MADPETLLALKRAYAETILNTTKEAAARVMVSEKKARGYQQELVTVKETEMISLKQQQKVEELEAQLGEAEDIVGELRMELRELHNELKKLSTGQTHLKNDIEEDPCWKTRDAAVSAVPEVSCSDERSGALGSCIPVEQSGSVAANGVKIPSLTLINSIDRCSYKDNKVRCHHTLPAILTKRREAEGFTQMIQTVDRSMVHGDLSSSVEVNEKDGVGLHKVPSCKSAETLEMSGCADASDSISSVRGGEDPMVSKKDFGTPISLKTSSTEHENDRKSAIGETETMKKEKESCESMDVSASPLCDETPGLAVKKNRCIKYTFKRKRKKEVLSNLEGDSSVEKNRNMKLKTEEKDDGYLVSRKKPNFTNESSRDSLRVAQLACQLVPFSESKGLLQS